MAIMAPTSTIRHSANTAAAMTGKPILTANSAVRRSFGRSSPTLDKAIMAPGLPRFGPAPSLLQGWVEVGAR